MKTTFIFLTLIMMSQISYAQEKMTLKNAIDEYNFSLTVEWDQKNMQFLEDQNQILESRILEIGDELTKQDVLDAFPGVDVFKIEEELLSKKIFTFQDLQVYMAANPALYAQGASWIGIAGTALGGAALITIGVFILKEAISLTKKARACRANGGYWSIEHICW